jgi:hypothetical protein
MIGDTIKINQYDREFKYRSQIILSGQEDAMLTMPTKA